MTFWSPPFLETNMPSSAQGRTADGTPSAALNTAHRELTAAASWSVNHCGSITCRYFSAPFAPRKINKRLCSNQLPTSPLPTDGVCVHGKCTGGRFCAHLPCGQAGGGGYVPEGIGGNGYVRGLVQGVVPRKRHDGPCSTTLRAPAPVKGGVGTSNDRCRPVSAS